MLSAFVAIIQVELRPINQSAKKQIPYRQLYSIKLLIGCHILMVYTLVKGLIGFIINPILEGSGIYLY